MGALRSALLLRTGLRARPAEVDRVLAPHCLVKGGGTTRGTQRRRRPILHSLGTTCGKLPNSGSRRGESLVSNGEAHRWKAPRVRQNASLFAERRGKRPWRRWQVAKAASFSDGLASSSGIPDKPRELLSGPAGRLLSGVWGRLRPQTQRRLGPLAAPSPKSKRLVGLAQAGPPGGLVMGTRKHVCTQRGRPLQPAFAASFTTAGVRADRVGAKLPLRAIATEGAGKAKAARPLTRETSAGSLCNRGSPRASVVARRHEGEPLDTVSRRRPAAAGWVLQVCASGRRVLGRGGEVSSSNVVSRMRTSSRTSAGRSAGSPIEAQTIRSVVLADCVDCRSRRAASGPLPNGNGSSLSLEERQKGAGSRIATAKS